MVVDDAVVPGVDRGAHHKDVSRSPSERAADDSGRVAFVAFALVHMHEQIHAFP